MQFIDLALAETRQTPCWSALHEKAVAVLTAVFRQDGLALNQIYSTWTFFTHHFHIVRNKVFWLCCHSVSIIPF